MNFETVIWDDLWFIGVWDDVMALEQFVFRMADRIRCAYQGVPVPDIGEYQSLLLIPPVGVTASCIIGTTQRGEDLPPFGRVLQDHGELGGPDQDPTVVVPGPNPDVTLVEAHPSAVEPSSTEDSDVVEVGGEGL